MKHVFEKYATPISIIVAGALVGVGLIVSKVVTKTRDAQPSSETTAAVTADSLSKLSIVKKLGIKAKDLSECISAGKSVSVVDADIALGTAAGLQGTPHMIIMEKKNGKDIQFQIFGALDQATIEQAIADGATPPAQQSYKTKFAVQALTPDDHVLGNPATAPATIIEYSDIDCPFCKKLQPTLQTLVDQGKIAWVYRHSPIPSLHPNARIKALASECVYELAGSTDKAKGNDAFWKYLDTLVTE